MLHNYLKLTYRHLTRQKAFSFINIAGLAIGLASSLIILLWVQDEVSYDSFPEKANRTYRIVAQASDLQVAISPAPMGAALLEQFPEVRYAARFWRVHSLMLEAGDKKFEEHHAFYTEPSAFDIFDFQLLHGDNKTALTEPNSIVLSEALALKYFGTTDAIGRVMRKENQDDLKVTGVLAPPKGNSHLRIDMLLPWSFIASREYNVKNNVWDNFDYYTYITFDKPRDKAFITAFETKIDQIYRDHDKELKVEFQLQPLEDIHLHSHLMAELPGNGSAQYVTALTIIAVFIVLIGCINFMNLSTARSARRAREVGLRKVSGAVRIQLVKQFMGESLLITTVALVVAIAIVSISLPAVNNLVAKHLSLDLSDPYILGSLLAITLLTGVLAGLYPAMILSGFTPIKVLRKDVKAGAGGTIFRNVLVVTQFVISISLLVGTAVVYQQLQFIRTKDLGFAKENLLYVNIHGKASEKINTWRAAFEANPLTANVTIASGLPVNLSSGASGISWQGKDPNTQIVFAELHVDEHFLPIYDIELAAGRNLHEDLRGDSSNFIINQTAAKIMGFTDASAIGQELTHWDYKGVIIGVVKDFNFKPLQESIEPLILSPSNWRRYVVVKASPEKTAETIAAMEKVWNTVEDIYPFTYSFVDQDLEDLYQSEKQVGTLFTVFASLAIFISCLGLYGLSAYMAEQRNREIGIRKALGASVSHIVYLLNARFVIPVLIAILLAAPLAYFAMHKWLEGFAYKIDFQWGLVFIAGALALVVSLATVTYESVKAALMNPLKSLRTE